MNIGELLAKQEYAHVAKSNSSNQDSNTHHKMSADFESLNSFGGNSSFKIRKNSLDNSVSETSSIIVPSFRNNEAHQSMFFEIKENDPLLALLN